MTFNTVLTRNNFRSVIMSFMRRVARSGLKHWARKNYTAM